MKDIEALAVLAALAVAGSAGSIVAGEVDRMMQQSARFDPHVFL
jgi:hypothetical protein